MLKPTQNFFVIVSDNVNPIMRIQLTKELQIHLTRLFEDQRNNFMHEKNEVEFTSDYKVEFDEVFAIKNFNISPLILTAIQNPLECPILDQDDPNIKIKAIFSGKGNPNKEVVFFQYFNKSNVLLPGLTILGSKKTYRKLEDPGLTFSEHLTAVYENKKLLFTSYHKTRRFLDLSQYYREASDEELDLFSECSLFEFERKESFKENSDSIIRKKIALILSNNILDYLTIDKIKKFSLDLNQLLPEDKKINIIINNGRLIIPEDRKRLKELIKFLDEDYFITSLTQQRCVTNSKIYLKK